ncbi:hypothetical protein SAMN04244547_04244 [Azotobacter vinelandii]|nr:hypothetical protein SAMN04244547_04244 [Azotobacter vinelandii]
MQMFFLLIFRRLLLQLLQQPWSQSLINNVIGEQAEVLGAEFRIFWRVLQATKAEQFFVVFGGERADVWLQFFRYPCLKDLRESVFGAITLITRCFVNKRDDANSSKAANKNFALHCDVSLLRS